jgi:3-deoxy-D-manno-octulosonate 8-phosphate phosphatase (KDO 8-P phosphatase)
VNDLGLIEAIGAQGLTGAPADAMPTVAEAVHYICSTPGGRGAFREFADWLIALRGETAGPGPTQGTTNQQVHA